ncbi:hypothetical protein Rsub_04114 [Raphidocelis subcapitata]|uniref:YrhK domain-containing protein n=1 Tax=Raphidocelis subcapitata TaxID=307507 RepID=A0A2V0NUQ7_9CHLO|nr:hypothetical protein Rsub_04114 [Raphidocelis subcapitata]|eukprot:GBF91374.1 hypothetical protein Rsub_04114 [Raphidocelis subcapitata]
MGPRVHKPVIHGPRVPGLQVDKTPPNQHRAPGARLAMGQGADEPLLSSPLEHHELLLGEYDHGARPTWHPENLLWQALHAFSFLLGGTTFIAGTAALFWPGNDTLSASLYVIGSLGFLAVDVQEWLTFSGAVLRTNICLSMTGSALYVAGSAGFLPAVAAAFPRLGVWGFVLGSAYIAWSQLWKTHRIGGGELEGEGGEDGGGGGFRLRSLLTRDAATAAGVELSAGIGALCFLFGTLLFDSGPLEGPKSVLQTVLWIWVAGSCWFTLGGCFLAWRHFVMRVV